MKIKTKVIASDYNEETGLSSVTIATDIGIFEGVSKLNPEDAEIASRFAGCRYAEMRANIKYLKEKTKIADYKLQYVKKIFNNLKNIKTFKNKKVIKMLEKEIYLLEDEKITFQQGAKSLKENLNKAIDSRPDLIKKLKEKRKDNE